MFQRFWSRPDSCGVNWRHEKEEEALRDQARDPRWRPMTSLVAQKRRPLIRSRKDCFSLSGLSGGILQRNLDHVTRLRFDWSAYLLQASFTEAL
jgi:hypothetical protein